MNLLALPLTTKLIAGLGLALALSLSANVLQLRAAWIGAGEAKGAAAREALADQLASVKQTNATNTALAEAARVDRAGLLNDLMDIAERSREVRTVYRTVAAKTPLAAVCAPGQARLDAVNTGLGAARGGH